MENMTIGGYIKHLREQKNYSQRKLAILANISNTTISRIELDLNVPDLDTLNKIASALKIPVEDLLSRTDVRNPEQAMPDPLEKYPILKEALGAASYNDGKYGTNYPEELLDQLETFAKYALEQIEKKKEGGKK